MTLYHGTTSVHATRMRKRGIGPETDSTTIWFSRSIALAQLRAEQLCRHGRGKPVVAVCRLDLRAFRRHWGDDAVRDRDPMVGLTGHVEPESIVRIQPVPAKTVVGTQPVLTADEVFRLLDSPSPRVRLMGVLMLSTQRSAQAFDWLCTCLKDQDHRVRLAVAMALRRHGAEAEDLLRQMSRDEDPRVRRAVQGSLRAHAITTA